MQPLGGANSALVAKVAVLKVCRPMKSTLSECSTAGFWGEQVKTSGFPTVGQGWRGSILLSTTVDWFCSTSTAESKFLLTLTKFDVQMECSWPSFFSPRGLEPGVRGHRCWFFLYSKGEGNMSQKIVSSAKKKKKNPTRFREFHLRLFTVTVYSWVTREDSVSPPAVNVTFVSKIYEKKIIPYSPCIK